MKRRNVLGLVVGAVSGSLVVGSGAFNTARTDREISANVVTDERAYLALNALPSKNESGKTLGRSRNSGYQTKFRFPGMKEEVKELTRGDGIGTDSKYYFDRLVEIRNQGTHPVTVFTEYSGELELVALYDSNDTSRSLLTDESRGIKLTPGSEFEAGVAIDSSGVDSRTTVKDSVTIVGKATDDT